MYRVAIINTGEREEHGPFDTIEAARKFAEAYRAAFDVTISKLHNGKYFLEEYPFRISKPAKAVVSTTRGVAGKTIGSSVGVTASSSRLKSTSRLSTYRRGTKSR